MAENYDRYRFSYIFNQAIADERGEVLEALAVAIQATHGKGLGSPPRYLNINTSSHYFEIDCTQDFASQLKKWPSITQVTK